jgi:nucleosome binding factor SPN SPT16 subunit
VGEHVESCYIPIIQSGGKYDLKLSATNDDENLHFGTIVCALGARYQFVVRCSNERVIPILLLDKKYIQRLLFQYRSYIFY